MGMGGKARGFAPCDTCGVKTRDGGICPTCWRRIPLTLQREYQRSGWPGQPYNLNKAAVIEQALAWLKDNPAPPPEPRVPAWKIDRRRPPQEEA